MIDKNKSKAQLLSELKILQKEIFKLNESRYKQKIVEEERNMLLKAIETTKEAIMIITPDALIIYANDSMNELFGYEKGELVGKHVSILNAGSQEKAKEVARLIDETTQRKGVWEGEILNKRKDGKEFLSQAKITVLRDKSGNIINYISIQRDITKYKHAEEALQESLDRYYAIFEQAADSIVLIDGETGELVEFNDKAHETLGFTRDEFKKLKIPDFEIIESAVGVSKHIKKIIKKGADTFETKHRTKSGEIRDIHVNSKTISIRGKNYVQSMWRDITEHKQAEEAIRESEERLRLIISSMNDLLFVLDKNGNFISYFQPPGRPDLYVKPEEFLGKSFKEMLPPYATAIFEETFFLLKKKKSVQQFDYPLEIKGKEFWFSANLSIKKSSSGKFDGVIAVVRDITNRKQVEEQLLESQKQMRELTRYLQSTREKERTRVAREIHDEMGQALTALKMDLFWLNKNLSEDQVSIVSKIESMIELTDITIKKVQRISSELRPGILDDLGISNAIEWQTREFQKRTGIKCELNIEPEEIVLDKERSTTLFRIFQETLTNVARHAKASKIKVNLIEKADIIELKVKDNGRGITREQISDPGSLGLIGMQERVFLWGGEVKITGIQDKGTTVKVIIPLGKGG